MAPGKTPLPVTPGPGCHQVGSVLQAYLDGELGPSDTELVAEHLQHCQRCGVEAETVNGVIDATAPTPDLDPAPRQRLTRYVDQPPTDNPPAQ